MCTYTHPCQCIVILCSSLWLDILIIGVFVPGHKKYSTDNFPVCVCVKMKCIFIDDLEDSVLLWSFLSPHSKHLAISQFFLWSRFQA